MSSASSTHRSIVRTCVCAILQQSDFSDTQSPALEILLEIVIAYITELSHSSKVFTEIANRNETLPTDVIGAMVEMGISIPALLQYMKKPCKVVLQPPAMAASPMTGPLCVEGGKDSPGEPHVPDYLPGFPQPHTYIRTEAPPEPVCEYRDVRERVASQRKDIERSLTNLIARTRDTSTLFSDDPTAFPLISHVPGAEAYRAALLAGAEGAEEADERDLEAGLAEQEDVQCLTASQRIQWLKDAQTQDSDDDESQELGESSNVNPYLRKPTLRLD